MGMSKKKKKGKAKLAAKTAIRTFKPKTGSSRTVTSPKKKKASTNDSIAIQERLIVEEVMGVRRGSK
jgi:hypothetical protein